jgi:hypothetical protein
VAPIAMVPMAWLLARRRPSCMLRSVAREAQAAAPEC